MTKAISLENLQEFKNKCDQTYAPIGGGGGGGTQLYRYRIDINALSSADLSTFLINVGITYIEFVSNRNDITSFSTLYTPDKFLSIVRLSGGNGYNGTLETYKNFIIGDKLYIKAEFLNTDGTITTNEFQSAEDITWDGGAEITPL